MTISSAPEHDEDTLWLHIRVCGQWTRKLYQKYVQFENIKVIDSAPIWGNSTFGGKDNLGFNEITFEINETNGDKKHNTMVHFNNNVNYIRNTDTDENDNQKQAATDVNDDPNKKDSVSINLGGLQNHGLTPVIQQHPYNSTPLYAFNGENNTNHHYRNHTQAYYLNASKLERTSPIQRSISNVSSSMPLCKLNKGKACRLFNECDLGCDDQEHENNFREFNKTVRYPMRILIDGPYGTPSSDIFNAEHAVLIAPGIGVTPFASILQSIMIRYQESKHICPSCSFKFSDGIPKSLMKLKKVALKCIKS